MRSTDSPIRSLDAGDRSIGKLPQVPEVAVEKLFEFFATFFFFDLGRYFDAFDAIYGDMADALFSKLLPYFLGNPLDSAFQGFLRIYLQNQVHAPLKVKT